jgi:hypothetical protein
MDVLALALEEKKAASPPLLKTDGEARPSQDRARERERSGAPPAQAQTSWVSIYAIDLGLWQSAFSLFSSLSPPAFSGGCMRANSSPRTTPLSTLILSRSAHRLPARSAN